MFPNGWVYSQIKNSIRKTPIVFFGLFQLLLFLPALKHSNPWSDDWGYIFFVDDDTRNIVRDAIAAGRPILGFIVQLTYQSEFIKGNLILLQLLSLLGILTLQMSIYSKLKIAKFGGLVQYLTALAVVLIPGFQGYVYFLSCFPYSWACLLGFLSYDLINNGSKKQIVIGIIFLVLSFLIYPAGAMFYFVSYFIDYIPRYKRDELFRRNINHFINIFLKLVGCSALSFVIANFTRIQFGIEQATRIELVNNLEALIDKFYWVVTRLFVSEFRIFTVASPSPLQAAFESFFVFSLITLFIFKPFKRWTLNRFLNFGFMLVIPLFGALPNLVIRENQFEFRTLTSLFTMSLMLWSYTVSAMAQSFLQNRFLNSRFSLQIISRVTQIILIITIFFAAFQVQQDSRNLWIGPSLARDKITVNVLRDVNPVGEEPICMVIPKKLFEPLDRLGIYSMKSDLLSFWVPDPYMRQQLKNLKLFPHRQIIVLESRGECPASSILADYGALRVNFD